MHVIWKNEAEEEKAKYSGRLHYRELAFAEYLVSHTNLQFHAYFFTDPLLE